MARYSRFNLIAIIGLLLALGSPAMGQSGCGGQAPASTYCGNPGATLALPGWKPLSGIPTVRKKLSTSTAFYWGVGGTNSTSCGLTDVTRCATVQYLWDLVSANYDTGNNSVSFVVPTAGVGTLTSGLTVNAPLTGGGSVTFQGDPTTPSNVTISTTSANNWTFNNISNVFLNGFKCQIATSGYCVTGSNGIVTLFNMEFGAAAQGHMQSGPSFFIIANPPYKISGSTGGHLHCVGIGGGILVAPGTITLTGTPNFSAYYAGANQGICVLGGSTFVGSGTGQKFLAHFSGVIQATPNDENYLPGDVAGNAYEGGMYVGSTVIQGSGSRSYVGFPGTNQGSIGFANTLGGVTTLQSSATAANGTLSLPGGIFDTIAVRSIDNLFTAQQSVSGSTINFTAFNAVSNDNSATQGPYINLQKLRANPAINDDNGIISFNANNASNAGQRFASIVQVSKGITAGSERGALSFRTLNGAGSFVESLSVASDITNVKGALNISALPTSAGAGGLYVCIDTAGALYKKASCP